VTLLCATLFSCQAALVLVWWLCRSIDLVCITLHSFMEVTCHTHIVGLDCIARYGMRMHASRNDRLGVPQRTARPLARSLGINTFNSFSANATAHAVRPAAVACASASALINKCAQYHNPADGSSCSGRHTGTCALHKRMPICAVSLAKRRPTPHSRADQSSHR
jgi:hypothetical protein